MGQIIGQILSDVIIRPIFAIWITLVLHWQKALLYLVLAFIGGNNWLYTKNVKVTFSKWKIRENKFIDFINFIDLI